MKREQLEKRRWQALALHRKGLKQVAIARKLGVTQGAVSRWLRMAREGGAEALRIKKPTGIPPRLPLEKQKQLPVLLARGPRKYGFADKRWTRSRIGDVIRREFGVSYSDENVSYILRKIGWKARPLQRRKSGRRNSKR
jgi:transposase